MNIDSLVNKAEDNKPQNHWIHNQKYSKPNFLRFHLFMSKNEQKLFNLVFEEARRRYVCD